MGDGRLRRREVVEHGGSTVPRNVTGRREASEYSQKRQFFSMSVSKYSCYSLKSLIFLY